MLENKKLEEAILQEVCRDKVPVTLFLMNGFQLRGVITGFDSFVVVLISDGKQQVIYKHAISTLAPIRSLKAATPSVEEQTGDGAITPPPVSLFAKKEEDI